MENPLVAPERHTALLGRTAECALLDELIAAIRRGESRVLVIRGEAGIGKTELLRYLIRSASEMTDVRAAGVESEMELPYASLHQLCLPLLDGLASLPGPQRRALEVVFGLSAGAAPNRLLVGLAVLSLISEAGEERPLLCVIDDAQWLDQASALTLAFAARRLHADPVGIVFAAREPSDDSLSRELPELRLGGLEEVDARALLSTVVPGRIDERVRDQIVAETHGNPLAILELPRSLSAGELAGGFALPDPTDLPGRIEEAYVQRASGLPEPTRRLLLLAAADPLGDVSLLWRAAERLGIHFDAAIPAATEQLLEIGARVRFRHPLVRSAVYRASSAEDRQAAHEALAASIDSGSDPDRRAWHRAHAVIPPNEDVARELIECASGAERRGGVAAAAALLERAVAFTEDPAERASRALIAAQAKFAAADYTSAAPLLVIAEAGPLDELGQARVQQTRAQQAFDLRRGRDAPLLLLRAAQRLERVDAELAQETYLEALLAAIYASRLANGTDVADVALAARETPLGPEPIRARQLLLRGLGTRLTDGYAAAAPMLSAALRAYRAEERRVDWLGVAYNIAAMELWDDETWFELGFSQAELARATGTLILLPYALDYLAGFHIHTGELSVADGLSEEAEGLSLGTRAATLPYTRLRVAAWRGQASIALNLVDVMTSEARQRGEGCAVAAAKYSAAVLHNGLGQYDRAVEAALDAVDSDDIATSSWALPELVEAASRSGRHELACSAMERLAERTSASGTLWAKGTEAHARALVEDDGRAEELHREAIEWLARSRMKAHLARARLSYGEWLRRESRRFDAREELRGAFETFSAIGAEGFADRARHELAATGEKVLKRRDDARDELTPKEERIARLARDGRTNLEIGAELFISARTVEWHMRKVFGKLGITSRTELHHALRGREHEAAPL